MRNTLFLIIIVFFVLTGCRKTDLATNNNYIIKAGFECGWGSGMDSIEISRTTIQYAYYIPSKSLTPIIIKSRTVPDNEWSDILSIINMDDFVKLNYNSCNICFDGCDEWICIQKNKVVHKITFGKGSKIDSISKLQNKLAELRTEFNN